MSQSIIKWRGLESERCSWFVDSYIFEKSICQDEKDKIECYGGRKIKITLAYYGRTKVFKCGLGFSTNCKAKGSEDKVTPDKPLLIRTPRYCRQTVFSLSLGKESPYIFCKFNPLNTDIPLIWTLSMAPARSVFTGLTVILFTEKKNKHRLITGKVTVKECLAESEFERCTTLVSCNICQRVASSEIKVFRLLFL